MKNHDGMIRGFHWSNKAWYSDVIKQPEIIFGMYSPDGGTSGEMSIRWIELSRKLTPKLECFDDAWNALSMFTDLIEEMGKVDSEDITDQDFVDMLKNLGFKDLTKYKSPYEG